MCAELGIHRIDELLALGLDQDLDARLVQVVAPAVAVVDAHDGLDEDEDLLPGQELADDAADDRRAAHAAADQHLEADLAGVVLQQLQADVVPADGGAVFARAGDGDLELARQEGELRVQRAPLAQDLAVGPRVDHLVGRDAGQRVAGDVADAVAAGLDAVHVDVGQQVHHVGGARQRDPVELQVLARGEVAVVAVELARDARQLAQLAAAQLAVGHGHAQHRRMALHVPAVLQAQRPELVVGSSPARWRRSWSRNCAARARTNWRSKSVYWYMVMVSRAVGGSCDRRHAACTHSRTRAGRSADATRRTLGRVLIFDEPQICFVSYAIRASRTARPVRRDRLDDRAPPGMSAVAAGWLVVGLLAWSRLRQTPPPAPQRRRRAAAGRRRPAAERRQAAAQAAAHRPGARRRRGARLCAHRRDPGAGGGRHPPRPGRRHLGRQPGGGAVRVGQERRASWRSLARSMDESAITDWSFPGRGLIRGEALARYVREHDRRRAASSR